MPRESARIGCGTMGASRTLTAEQRKARAKLASVAAHERQGLIKGIAEAVIGKPLDRVPTDELQAQFDRIAAGAPLFTAEQVNRMRPVTSKAGAR